MDTTKEVPIPLFTSLPPKVSRRGSDGREIGPAYAQACLDSWVSSGFLPISLNSQSEEIFHPERRNDIEVRTLKRDAQREFGKPLPYLSDIIEEMKGEGSRVVALTNSDIVLNFSSKDKARLQSLRPGECVVAKRVDISSPEERSGKEFPYGYDFFAFHTSDIPSLESDIFVMGKPWWDHFLPLCLLLSGVRPVDLGQSSVLHLAHEERWLPQDYISIGEKFAEEIKQKKNSARWNETLIDLYFSELEALNVSPRFPHRLKKYLMKPSSAETQSKKTKELRRLGGLNRRTIEAWRRSASLSTCDSSP